MELLKDKKLQSGVRLKGLNSLKDGHASVKDFSLTGEMPAWYLCQWNSKYNLKNGVFEIGDGKYSVSDESKIFTVYKNGDLEFELNARREYAAARRECEPWPHLLIEQEITENNRVKDMRSIVCSADFRLEKFKNYMGAEEREYHTAQFVWVVTLKDDNPSSPSYNSFIWVVMCPFDSRYDYAPLSTMQDTALPDGEFIYSFCASDFIDKPMKSGETVKMRLDLYPHLGRMLQCAQNKGFMKGSRAEDLVISSTNMGFEITGTFDCRVSVKNLGIHIG